ncbi:MMPL family transporter [Trinickia sp. NRRL B-1857]|uniref:MMPL family transporter n=1 Tax=Trinickia sp. NRRL B-1857 TaxID=3162879 RepID=UPI003D2DA7FA
MRVAQPAQVKARLGVLLVWIAIACIAIGYCSWRFAGPAWGNLAAKPPLQTNLLALLPKTEADPVAEQALDALASTMGERAVYLVTSDDAAHAKAAARRLGQSLAASGAFRHVLTEIPPFDVTQVARFYLPYRFALLTSADRAALASGSAALPGLLAERLFDPLRAGLAAPLADDPFGWLSRWLGALPLGDTNLTVEDGLLVAHRGTATSVLITATLPGSAYETSVQHAVRQATAAALSISTQAFPDVRVARTGAVFYADAARRASEEDVHRIGLWSTCGIALLMLWIFRSPRLIALGFVSTAIGIGCALAVTMAVFGQLHLLTLVFGASLIGEAVDYSIQYFVVYLSTAGQWDAQRGLREVRPALLVALATSLLGYAILMWAPFPALKQIACFAMVGIGAAFLAVTSLLPVLLRRAARRTPIDLFHGAARLLSIWRAVLDGRRAWFVAALVLAAALPGWMRLTSDDDIHLLVQRDRALATQERAVREAIGVDDGARMFVVKGATPEAVLERCEALGERLDAPLGGRRLAGWQSVSQFVPSARRQEANLALLESGALRSPEAMRAVLIGGGLREEAADRYVDAWTHRDAAPLTLNAWLSAPWSQPYRHLWLGAVGQGDASRPSEYAAIVMPLGATPAQLPALAALAHVLPGVVFVDKAASVSRLFGAYRFDSALWLAAALALVSALLAARYRLRGGVRVVLPVVLAVAVALAAFGYAGVPLTLFNWLALMLVLGVGVNYAVFLREGCLREGADLGAVWTGVALSAATTLLSFGLLAMSSMPVLKSFGATLALGIAVSVLLAPIGMPQGGERR